MEIEHVSIKERLAQLDHRVNKRLSGVVSGGCESDFQGEYYNYEVLGRPGEQRVGVITPDFVVLVTTSRNIIHEYDRQGRLKDRWVAGNPPSGYKLLDEEQYQLLINSVLNFKWPGLIMPVCIINTSVGTPTNTRKDSRLALR